MEIIYGTIIYDTKNFDEYLHDFFCSVIKQTYHNFSLLLINDNVPIGRFDQINEYFNLNIEIEIIHTYGSLTPAKLRERLIKEAHHRGASLLIFSDFDDTASENRVQEIVRQIDGYSFAYQDFFVVDRKNNLIDNSTFFESREIPDRMDTVFPLLSSNFLGLGGLTLNMDKIDISKINIPDDIIAVDWFLPTFILLFGGEGIKIKEAYTYYRQHRESYVGTYFKLSDERLTRGLNVKKAHYRYFSSNKNKEQEKFRDLYNKVCILEKYLRRRDKREAYIKYINKRFDTKILNWWENIKTLEEINCAEYK